MTKKEKLVKVLQGIPDELVDHAYSLDLGTNSFRVSLRFTPEYLKHYRPNNIDLDDNGFLTFHIESGDELIEVTMT